MIYERVTRFDDREIVERFEGENIAEIRQLIELVAPQMIRFYATAGEKVTVAN